MYALIALYCGALWMALVASYARDRKVRTLSAMNGAMIRYDARPGAIFFLSPEVAYVPYRSTLEES